MGRKIALLVTVAVGLSGCTGGPELTAQMLVRDQASSVVLAYSATAGELGDTVTRMMGEQVSMNTGNALLLERPVSYTHLSSRYQYDWAAAAGFVYVGDHSGIYRPLFCQ